MFWVKNEKKSFLMSLFSNTMLICFFDVFPFSLIFFVLTPKTLNHSPFGLKKLTLSCFGSKTKKNQFCCLYFQIRCSYVSLMCSRFLRFFFVLTPKTLNHSPFGLKKLTLSCFGSKTKKNQF